MSLFRIQLIGYLGADAQISEIENGAKVVNFSVAHTELNYKYETSEKPIWIKCSKWINNQSFNMAFYNGLKKGVKIYVEGKPRIKKYVGKGGEMNSSFEILVDSIEFLNPKPNE